MKGKDFRPSGVVVPVVTAFSGEDSSHLDLEKMDRLTDFLIDNGVHGLMPLGTSGEFALLSSAEREALVRRVVRKSAGRVPVIAGVSEPGTQNMLAQAKAAEKAGADAVIATGPYYFKTSEEGLLLHYQRLLDSVALPIMIYNIPSYTGYNIPPKIVQTLSQRNPGRVVGVKFTTNDLELFLEYVRVLSKELRILIGADSLFLAALNLGAAGGVLGSANVLPKELSAIYHRYSEKDVDGARKLQDKIDGFTSVMTLGTYPAALKSALSFLGVDCGNVRPPLVPLSKSEAAKVKAALLWKKKERKT